jgi:UDP-N-acetylmuramoyl-L-alanyl-D-glutamate--2,6-diaminopimelate ligase
VTFLQLISEQPTLFQRVTGAIDGDPEIYGIEYDSRRIRPGYLFVAMRGESTDGNRFIDAAVAAGAVAVISDSAEMAPREGIAWARTTNGRHALAHLSERFFDFPARKLKLSGVTGTNGKTTTTFLMESILRAAARTTVLVGTIEYHVAGEVFAAPHTTPESLDLQRLFHKGVEQGASEAVMEASSHALEQGRTWGLRFDVAVFTNLTRDHLDYHGDFENYFAAKRKLFEGAGAQPPRVAVVNIEDEYGRRLAELAHEKNSEVLTYGLNQGDLHAGDISLEPAGTRFTMKTPAGEVKIASPLIGRVNVHNILAASAAALARGCSLAEIARGVAALERVPGRFERVDCGQPFAVVVDYAHTDDALRNLTRIAREFVSRDPSRVEASDLARNKSGRVISLFGCGGDRDRSKRPRMGQAAGEGSDFVVLTSDNPRSEDPMAIIAEAERGLRDTGVKYEVEPARRRAIKMAVGAAREGDIVLLAGKGHEKVQVLKDKTIAFDDVEVAREVLRELGWSGSARADEEAQGARGPARGARRR